MIKVYQLTQPQNNFIVMIPYKGCQVEAKFEKGNVSKGVYARLHTNDKFVQRAVEASEMYGHMYKLVETVPEPEDNIAAAKAAAKEAPETPVPQTPANQQTQEPAPEGEGTSEDEGKKDSDEGKGADDGKMVFANLGDAIVYVAQNFQVSVKSEAEARNVLKEHGILPVIKRG